MNFANDFISPIKIYAETKKYQSQKRLVFFFVICTCQLRDMKYCAFAKPHYVLLISLSSRYSNFPIRLAICGWEACMRCISLISSPKLIFCSRYKALIKSSPYPILKAKWSALYSFSLLLIESIIFPVRVKPNKSMSKIKWIIKDISMVIPPVLLQNGNNTKSNISNANLIIITPTKKDRCLLD